MRTPFTIPLVLIAGLLVGWQGQTLQEPAVQAQTSIQKTMESLYVEFKPVKDGAVADYIPELAKVDADLFGVCIATVRGKVFNIGDSRHLFTIQSGAKPFVFGLALEDYSLAELIEQVGVEPTGMPFNSILPPEIRASKTQNPLVNPGAIATASLIKGKDAAEKYERVHSFMEGLAGMELGIDQDVFRSEMATNSKNMGLAWLLQNNGLLYSKVDDAVMRYTKAGCIAVSAESLARMGATLAHGGVNPTTGKRILSSEHVQDVLSVMTMAGLYDGSGDWWVRVGLPAKSGVGGGILAVVPGRFAIAVFSPRLDKNGNSVRAVRLIQAISKRLQLHLLRSR